MRRQDEGGGAQWVGILSGSGEASRAKDTHGLFPNFVGSATGTDERRMDSHHGSLLGHRCYKIAWRSFYLLVPRPQTEGRIWEGQQMTSVSVPLATLDTVSCGMVGRSRTLRTFCPRELPSWAADWARALGMLGSIALSLG